MTDMGDTASEISGAMQKGEIKFLQAKRGDTFAIHLWEDRTRGEQWVPTYDPKSVVLVEDEFLRTTSNNAVDSGQRTFEFQALVVGEHCIEFNKRLAWKFTAEDRRVFLVSVKDG
jgi:predicted secreted protein